jgi:hypothetical protein
MKTAPGTVPVFYFFKELSLLIALEESRLTAWEVRDGNTDVATPRESLY